MTIKEIWEEVKLYCLVGLVFVLLAYDRVTVRIQKLYYDVAGIKYVKTSDKFGPRYYRITKKK